MIQSRIIRKVLCQTKGEQSQPDGEIKRNTALKIRHEEWIAIWGGGVWG